jgi:hypothetical protein
MKNPCALVVGKTSNDSEVLIVSKRSSDAAVNFILHLGWLVQEDLLDRDVYLLIIEEGHHYNWIINAMIKQGYFSEEAYAFAMLARGPRSWRELDYEHAPV